MQGSYHPWLVMLSMAVAVMASYVALDLASRVTASRGGSARWWLAGGAASMGMGIWSMHFIAMLAFELPFPVSYRVSTTVLSLLIAMVASALALHLASGEHLRPRRLLGGAVLMGLGIAAMHYTGMSAMRMNLPIRYDPLLFTASLLIAIAASGAAMWLQFRLRDETSAAGLARKAGSAVVMGAAICGMHYTGMAAANFDPGCLPLQGGFGLDPAWLAVAIGSFTFMLLGTTLLVSLTDARRLRDLAQAQAAAEHAALEARVTEHERYEAVLLREISERRRAARRVAAQTSAAAALVESDSLQEAAPKVLQAVCNALDWSVGALWLNDAVSETLLCAEFWHSGLAGVAEFESASRSIAYPPGRGLPGRIWESGRPVWIPDVTLDGNFPRANAARSAGLRGAFGFPVTSGGMSVAVIEFFSETIQEPDPELLAMMDTLGSLIGQFIARVRGERALEQEEQFLSVLLDNVSEGIVACDEQGRLTRFNRAAREWHGLAEQPLALPPERWAECYDLYLPDGRTPVPMEQMPLLRAFRGEPVRDTEVVIAAKGREPRVVLCNGRALVDRAGSKLGAVIAMHDITKHKQAEHNLQQLAHFDPLTGLPNRRLFGQSLRQALDHADAEGLLVSLLFMDLDHFKDINDNLGHMVGDELLRHVGDRLLSCVRVRDTVARLGGDEFGVIVPTGKDPAVAASIAEKIQAAMVAPFELGEHTVSTTASIGITIYPADTGDPDSLSRFADMAMYEAKRAGRNVYRFYTEEMNLRARRKLELVSALREAMARAEFELHYQPKVNLQDGGWIGVEALLRWNRPGHGMVAPTEFVPVLEETGLIVPMGAWVIATACRQLRDWRSAGLPALPIAVNVSASQLLRKTARASVAHPESGPTRDLCAEVAAQLDEFELPPGLLEIELTESTLMADAEHSVEILRGLQQLGVRVSVDDFGTGYSSLAYLRRFPLDTVKIDGSFVRELPTNAGDASITLAIIGMAHQLNLQVVAEGVETEAQRKFLLGHGCDQAQGFLFAHPLSAPELERLWRRECAAAAGTPP